MGHEHGTSVHGRDAVLLLEHLHEVLAADQSAGMSQERDQHRVAAQIREQELAAVEVGQVERGRHVTNLRWVRRTSHGAERNGWTDRRVRDAVPNETMA